MQGWDGIILLVDLREERARESYQDFVRRHILAR